MHVWLDGCVVFDLATGDTHALDTMAGALFMAYLDGWTDLDTLPETVYSQLPSVSPLELEAGLRVARERLQQSGLLDSRSW